MTLVWKITGAFTLAHARAAIEEMGVFAGENRDVTLVGRSALARNDLKDHEAAVEQDDTDCKASADKSGRLAVH